MPNKTTIRLAVMASAAILLGVLAGTTYANAASREDNCRVADGADRATCCSKVESTSFFGRLFGGGCTVLSRGDLGHSGQQSASATGPKSSGGKESSGSGNTGSSGGAGDSGGGDTGSGGQNGGGNNGGGHNGGSSGGNN